jgi:lipoyl(octanoyl) transferase
MQITNKFPLDLNRQEYGSVVIRNLGLTDYIETWHAMQTFTHNRIIDTPDEIWITQHFPVYTLGLNRKGVSPPQRVDIPVVDTDRGGKITYHGPGQIMIYLLLNIKRMNMTVKQLVSYIETTLILLLNKYGVSAKTINDAPGVYVSGQKIAALGLRVKNGCSYHGVSLNVDMDLSPFLAIDPCGYKGLEVTQLRDLGIQTSVAELSWHLGELFATR